MSAPDRPTEKFPAAQPSRLDTLLTGRLQLAMARAAAPDGPITATVRRLEESQGETLALLREIVATFSIERNREKLLAGEGGKELLDLFDKSWKVRFERFANAPQPAEVA